MIYLLYGEDTYRSRQKLKEIEKKFRAKDASGINLQNINGLDVEFSDIKKSVNASPFLGEKRLIIIENILSSKNGNLLEKTAELVEAGTPQSSVVVFWQSSDFDKRKKLAKVIFKKGQIEEFLYLRGIGLNKWIESEIQARGGKIAKEAINKLASYVGPDLWQMANEIDKLIAYRLDVENNNAGRNLEIRAQDVDLLVKAKLDTNIFSFIDAVGKKNKNLALKLLNDQLESGQNALYLLSMIVYQFRNILIIKELLEKGVNQYQIIREVKIHPYVVKKTIIQAENFSFLYLKTIYQKFLDLDSAIKSGSVSPDLGLDLLVVGLCG